MIRRSTLWAGAAAGVSVVALTAGPALAATTYTVTAGTKTSGTESYTAKTTGTTPQIKFTDSTSGLVLGCDSGTATGTFQLGSHLPGTGLGAISATTWKNCKGPVGLILGVTHVGSWAINATGKTNAGGVTKGTITNINAKVADSGNLCSFTVTGSVNASVQATPTKQFLTVSSAGSTLTISGVSGCFGQVNNGDSANFAAKYKITAADGKLSITNP